MFEIEKLIYPDNPEVKSCASFNELYDWLVGTLDKIREGGSDERIGYVAGLVTSEGPENIDKNVKTLAGYTARIRERQQFPIFSSTDIFSKTLVKRLGHESTRYIEFWRRVFRSGRITDVFMAPRWEMSEGATDEHTLAKELSINIHYPTPQSG